MSAPKQIYVEEKHLRMYADGYSLRDIAARLGCSPATVLRGLHAAGIKTRPIPYPRQGRFPKPNSKTYWERIMRRWLGEFEIYRCTLCNTWKAGVDSSNKHCGPCHGGYAPKHDIPESPDSDWGSKANAYFESQIDPTYYTELRTQHSSPIAGIA